MASVAKWSKAPVCGTGDHGFESRRSPQYVVFPFAAPVAQRIEHWASDPGVAGSNPVGRATIPPVHGSNAVQKHLVRTRTIVNFQQERLATFQIHIART